MQQIRELYTKYDEIIKYSAYAFSGWVLSWVLFFYHAPLYDPLLWKDSRCIIELRV